MPEAVQYDVLFVDQSHNCATGPSRPLPTPNDIDGSEILLKQGSGCRIARMRQPFERFVVKFGIHVNPIEARNMLYVENSAKVPVPKVYAIYQRREKLGVVVSYIVMQYIPGTTLQDLWGSLDQTRKTAIARTLRTYFEQLRQLQQQTDTDTDTGEASSSSFFGNIAGGPPFDDMFSETQASGTHEVKTSLATEDELIDYIVRTYSLVGGERLAHKARYYRHVLPTVLRGSGGSPVFTHNDFQRKNVMVQPDGALVLIDWESASWYPSYWEYSTATFANGGWHDDWHDYVRIVLDEYPNQALWLSTMKNEMWF